MTRAGTFEHGSSVLQLRADPPDQDRLAAGQGRAAGRPGRSGSARPGTTRSSRPGTAWPSPRSPRPACCSAGPSFIAAARGAAALLAACTCATGRLARTSRDGVAGPSAGVLDDYACVADGFLALSGVTGEARWARRSPGSCWRPRWTGSATPRGGFYDTADDGEPLLYRPADPADGPSPSGTFAVAGALLSYAALTGSARHREAAGARSARCPRSRCGTRGRRARGWPWPRRCSPARLRSRSSARQTTSAQRNCTIRPCWPRRRAR